MDHSLPKQERICGKSSVSRLLAEGRYGYAGAIKYCWLHPNGEPFARIMVSVSKRLFKRAVKRNLLKRRLREAYRVRKELLPAGTDVMLIYNTKEILDQEQVGTMVEKALRDIAARQKAACPAEPSARDAGRQHPAAPEGTASAGTDTPGQNDRS